MKAIQLKIAGCCITKLQAALNRAAFLHQFRYRTLYGTSRGKIPYNKRVRQRCHNPEA